MKICHITTVHKDTDVRIFHKMCKSLALVEGFTIHLVVPNSKSRTEEGVQIHSFDSVYRKRSTRIRKAGKMALQLAMDIDADIYHLHDPELLFIAKKLKKKTHSKVIFDSHEDVPKQLLDKIWIPPLQRRFISWLYARYEKRICQSIDGIISVTPIICQRFKKFHSRVEMIANFPDKKEFPEMQRDGEFQRAIAYVGGIFKTRGIVELVTAIEPLDVTLILAGEFDSESLKKEVTALNGWKKVEYLGLVDREAITAILKRSEIGVVTLHPTQSYVESYPIKLFEYMATSNAILASDFSLWRSLMDPFDCGEMVDPLDINKITQTLSDMLSNKEKTRKQGANGYLAFQQTYNWESELEKLVLFYREVHAN